MKIGLCLAGGGAKGSYQAGVIKGLYDNGIDEIVSISGTSIGAVNGYYIYTGNVNNLQKMWINIQKTPENAIKIVDNTVDNSIVINQLEKLNNNINKKINFYVNYIEIEDKNICEKVVNLKNQDKDENLDSIKYSSLLPFNPAGRLSIKEQFMKDLQDGLYDGYKLDGGLVKNTLVEPLIKDNVDKIIIISTSHNYVLPESIKNQYKEENIIVVRPKTKFKPEDTLNFDGEFCKNIFEEGYDIGRNIML